MVTHTHSHQQTALPLVPFSRICIVVAIINCLKATDPRKVALLQQVPVLSEETRFAIKAPRRRWSRPHLSRATHIETLFVLTT
jgi:hypothetical protein